MSAENSDAGRSGIESAIPRFRFYVDESGDASPVHAKDPESQFLCLLGCIFEDGPYRIFHDGLETLKRTIFDIHHPDDPVVLHRTDLINRSGRFEILNDRNKQAEFNRGLLELITGTQFKIVASLVDKSVIATSAAKQGPRVDSYGYAYRDLLSSYTEFLEQEDAKSIIMLEARGGNADNLLKQAHDTILREGIGLRAGLSFRNRFNPAQLDLRQKNRNVSGLQLADILCHSIKCWMLTEGRLRDKPLGSFAKILIDNIRPQLLSHEIIPIAARGYLLRPRRKKEPFDDF